MKKLLLIRHAEAGSYSDKGDIGRPLTEKGEQDVLDLVKKLQATENVPQHVICSSALRTYTTAYLLTRNLALSAPLSDPAIYEASEKTLLKTINHFNDQFDFIAMVGHNPGIGYLLLDLTEKVRDVPPCTAICIIFEDAVSWQEVTHASGVITYYTTPAEK